MATYLLLVYTSPVPGWEDEYHAWYDNVHLDEVLTVPGFTAAQRYAVEPPLAFEPSLGFETAQASDDRYVAMFTVETDDIDAAMTTFDDMRAHFAESPAIDLDSVHFELLRAIGT